MAGDVTGKEAQKLPKHRVVSLGYLGTRQHDFAAGADRVVDLVAFAQPQGAAHGFRHRCLIAIGQRGFDFEGRRHSALQLKRGMSCMVMQLNYQVNAIALSRLLAQEMVRQWVSNAAL